ncbi:phosphoribosyl-ATP pyrophosphatase [Sphingomonas sp. Leaf407]|uniref:phosphoribosyl-ATP diphosphatase n=1 Tax=unclassified Sphingomonas TaxID=196159 RepID=UPI0006FD7F7B|nr:MULTISPECIES: phosphoribosyl-ATP diphosphatase [unclassified Sphingomonas]KQN34217.1 phosphoribosyl-ATP pyrophosphatase [Sphingomonas sp. Leaf42]KQT30660.1 phosphoribosyl-ATP pyrophosphatase [Sphingomonas sp. Leaf407]
MDALDHLESVIAARLHGDPAQSYVAKLHVRGVPKIAQKVGEEAVECVIAAMADDRAGLIGEAADLLFHLLVLLAEKRITLDEVRAELTRRDGLSGIAEKAARPKE